MQYQEAMEYIDTLGKFGSVLGLERISALLARLGNPQDDLRVIHVAGTNGKGSVCAFLSAMLQSAGYRVGRYISPSVYDYRERIQINGAYIPEESVCRHLVRIRAACDDMGRQGLEFPTAFEVETAMSFLHFAEEGCDFVVLEVGLGGRYDSTNVLKTPVLTVITSISMDHTDILGDTLAKIAYEKAGILKAGCPAVFYQQEPAAQAVLEVEAQAVGAPFTCADFAAIEPISDDLEGQSFHYGAMHDLDIRLLGGHQRKNAATAIEAACVLRAQGVRLDANVIRQGLREARWAGRFEVIHRDPIVIVDGAHNPDAASQLADAVGRYFAPEQVVLMMGVFADKDHAQILDIMRRAGHMLLTFTPDNPRALPSAQLAREAQGQFAQVIEGKTPAEALRLARRMVPSGGAIVCFGSLSTIGEITRLCAEPQKTTENRGKE